MLNVSKLWSTSELSENYYQSGADHWQQIDSSHQACNYIIFMNWVLLSGERLIAPEAKSQELWLQPMPEPIALTYKFLRRKIPEQANDSQAATAFVLWGLNNPAHSGIQFDT